MKKSTLIAIVSSVLLLGGGYLFYLNFLKDDDLLKRIPREPAWVATARIKSLADKLDMDKVKQLQIWNTLNNETKKGMSTEEKEFMDKLSSDPTFSGINFLQGVYAFGEWVESDMVTSIVFGVLSASKLEDFLKQMPATSRVLVSEREGCKVVQESDMLLIWDDDSGILIFGDGDMTDYGLGLMQMNESRSILKNEAFAACDIQDHDIGLFLTTDGLSRYGDRSIREMINKMELGGGNLMAALDFNSSSIDLTTVMRDGNGDKIANTVLKEGGLSEAFMNTALDENTMGFISMSFRTEKIVEWISLLPDYRRTMNRLGRELGCSVSDLEQMLGGQMVFGFSGMRKYENGGYPGNLTGKAYPEFTFSASLKRPEVFRTLMAKSGLVSTGEKSWRFIESGMEFHLIQTNEGISITTGPQCAESLKANGSLATRAKGTIRDLAEKTPIALYLNVNPDEYTEELVSSFAGRGQAATIRSLLGDFDHIELTTTGAESRFSIHIKDGDGNSLYRVVAMADRLATSL